MAMADNKTIPLTPEGRVRLEEELNHLRTEHRPAVVQRLQTAREESEAWDNPEFLEAKNELAFIDGRIKELERMLAQATVIPQPATRGVVALGSRVMLRNQEGEEEVYTIVGSAEAKPAEGRISDKSPVGKAVLGRRLGDTVEVETPAGPRALVIVKID